MALLFMRLHPPDLSSLPSEHTLQVVYFGTQLELDLEALSCQPGRANQPGIPLSQRGPMSNVPVTCLFDFLLFFFI